MSRAAAASRKVIKSEYIETVPTPPPPIPSPSRHGRAPPAPHINHQANGTSSPHGKDTGNKISRKARIEGKPNIMLGGRSVIMGEVCMRGDLHRFSSSSSTTTAGEGGEGGADRGPTTAISIGRYSVVATGTTLRPPCRVSRGVMAYYPMRIGDNVFIGPNCLISSVAIGSHVYIGPGCVLSPFCMIKENCRILPDTVVPPNMVVPPGSVVGGRPGRVLDQVGEGWGAGSGGPGEEWVEGGDLRELVRSIR